METKTIRVKAGEERRMFEHIERTEKRKRVTTKIVVEDHASLVLISLNEAGGKEIDISWNIVLGEKSRLHLHLFTTGTANITHSVHSISEGSDANSTIDWAFFAKNKEHYTLRATNVFSAPKGHGTITLKGIAQESAQVTCDGLIEIGKKGNGTDTYLYEDVLMLDPSAKINALPKLEIHTNDVKASHSATVSRITEEDLFYFAARGIPEKKARTLFIEGFMKEMVERIRHSPTASIPSAVIRNISGLRA